MGEALLYDKLEVAAFKKRLERAMAGTKLGEMSRAGDDTAGGATKKDAGKSPIWMGFLKYFPRAIEAVADVSLAGYGKYGSWGGWLNVPLANERYPDAGGRHVIAIAKGETFCPDLDVFMEGTGRRVRHKAQIAWNALADLELELRAEEKKEKSNA